MLFYLSFVVYTDIGKLLLYICVISCMKRNTTSRQSRH